MSTSSSWTLPPSAAAATTMSTNPYESSLNSKMTGGNVRLETSMGAIVCELYWSHAPKTCRNFRTLAMRGYYNDTTLHRIIPGFVIQGGDPTGTGKGGTSIYGDTFNDEMHPRLRHCGAGILSMANCGPNTNGSQFFITLAPLPHLDGKHTIFGRVQSGMRVVKRISMVQTDANDKPTQDIKIFKAIPC